MVKLVCVAMEDGDTPTHYLRRLAAAPEPHDSIPTPGMFYGWMHDGEPGADEFTKRYSRARRVRAAVWTDEVIAIANDGSNDSFVDSKGNRRIDFDVINRSKLRVDTIFRLLAVEQPKQFGTKVDVTSDGRPVPTPSAFVLFPATLPPGAPLDLDRLGSVVPDAVGTADAPILTSLGLATRQSHEKHT